jgi:hypothetical protein
MRKTDPKSIKKNHLNNKIAEAGKIFYDRIVKMYPNGKYHIPEDITRNF